MLDPSYLRFPEWVDEERFSRFQLPILEEIVSRFNEGNQLVIASVPCGGGKSLLAELTRQALHADAIYLTKTLSLQDQILRDFDHAKVLKGRANYIPTDAREDPWGNVPTCDDCDQKKKDDPCTFCRYPDGCTYKVARRDAADAELACLNYAYAFGSWLSGEHGPFYGWDLVIADECHSIPEEVKRHSSISIAPGTQKWLGLRPPERKTVESSWPAWFEYAIPHIEMSVKRLPNRTLKEKRSRRRLVTLLDSMRFVRDNIESYIYDYDYKGTVAFKPVTVEAVAPKVLWPNGKKWLAMSATVIPELLVRDTGFEGSWAPVFAPSTFDVSKRPIYFFPAAHMTKNGEVDGAWEKMAKTLRVLLDRYPDERVLVHTQSKKLTVYLADKLSDVDRPVFWYESGKDRTAAIESYDTTERAVLLAMSLKEGFDGKDDRVRCVVLCKVPFASLGDKQVNARLYGTPGGQYWYSGMTALEIMQACGRGVRHEDDYADTWVLDGVFAKFYREWKSGDGHRFFPEYITEAISWDGPEQFELKRALKNGGR